MRTAAKYLIILYSAGVMSTADVPTSGEWVRSGTVATLAGAMSLGLFFVPTPHCTWCDTNKFDVHIGRSLAVNDLENAAIASHIVALGAVPLVSLAATYGVSKSGRQFALNALILLDSALTTIAITQAIKVSTKRERPEVFFKFPYADDRIKNQSFPSGHTSLAFSLLSSASVLAVREKASWVPFFTAFAASAGLLVGYSRLASGKHWASDVLAGIGLGMAVGIATPFLIYELPTESSRKIALSIKPFLLTECLTIQASF